MPLALYFPSSIPDTALTNAAGRSYPLRPLRDPS